MKALSKVQLLVEVNGWSLARAQGFLDGEVSRRRGGAPSAYAKVGIDDYSLGFRAGYYERRASRQAAQSVVSTSAAAEARRAAPVEVAAWKETFEDVQLGGAS